MNSVHNCTVLAHDEDKGTNLSYSLNATSVSIWSYVLSMAYMTVQDNFL